MAFRLVRFQSHIRHDDVGEIFTLCDDFLTNGLFPLLRLSEKNLKVYTAQEVDVEQTGSFRNTTDTRCYEKHTDDHADRAESKGLFSIFHKRNMRS